MGNVHMEATQINYRGGSKKMSVEEAIKAAGTEITPEEKTWIDSIPTLTAGKADNGVIAPEFDSEEGVYAIGDLVMHEGKLYEFTTAHETAGDWDSTEVTENTVADEVNSVKSGVNKLNTIESVVRAYAGDTLKFNIPANDHKVWHFVAFAPDNNVDVQEGYILMRSSGLTIFNKVIKGTYTVSIENETKYAVVTLPANHYWEYSMVLVPTKY